VSVQIKGVKTEVLMAVAPTTHIPYSVVLGRNVPGLTLQWTLKGEDKTVPMVEHSLPKLEKNVQEREESSKDQVAGERASQVAQERAMTLAPAESQQKEQQLHPPREPQKTPQGKKVCVKNGRQSADGGGCNRIEMEEQLGEEQLPQKSDKVPVSPNLEEPISAQSSPISPNTTDPNMDIPEALNNIVHAVAMAVETRAGKWRRLQEERANQEATEASGVQLTSPGGPVTSSTVEQEVEQQTGEPEASNPEEDARLQDPAVQAPLPTAPPKEAGTGSQPTASHAQAQASRNTTKSRRRKGTKTKTNKKMGRDPVKERPKPDMEITRDKLQEEQLKDDLLGPILREKKPAIEPYVVKEGLVFAKARKDTQDQGEGGKEQKTLLVVVPETLGASVLHIGHETAGYFGQAKTRGLIGEHFFWPGMGRSIRDYCRTCPTCLQWNHHKEPKQPLQPLLVVSTPWSKVALDIVGPTDTSLPSLISAQGLLKPFL